MRKMGFSDIWLQWTRTLYRDATASVVINGKKSSKFSIERSVRQGCSLAPYLYLFISNVLSYMIADPVYGIEGFLLPNGSIVRDQCFADDTALYLKGSPENLNRVFRVLELFCSASGVRLNWEKSRAIWASNLPRTWSWGEERGLVWLEYSEVTRYLGFPFGNDISQKDKDAKVLHQVRSKLTVWNDRRLSLAVRVLVSNQVVLASIWYLASCNHIDKSVLLKIRTIIRNFIWSGSMDKNARAKVAWDTAVIPTIKGGLKIFDPFSQTRALLAKMVVRALALGLEPWKTLIQHRILKLQLRSDGDWGESAHWLCVAQKVKPEGSMLWQAIWRAWQSVLPGIKKERAVTHAEHLRQPLFFNNEILSQTGLAFGLEEIQNT